MKIFVPFKDIKFWCLASALLFITLSFVVPKIPLNQPVYRFVFIVDITRSMNTTDYQLLGKTVSRLAFVKHALRQVVRDLPCQSYVGLGLFTERRPVLLFEPIEVCENFNALSEAIDQIDWRMAWAADSYVAKGLFRSVYLIKGLNSDLVFLSDGHEAPPVNENYLPKFEGKPGQIKGLVVGTGGKKMSPIPKFNEDGEQTGFYNQKDVPHETRFGIPPKSFQELEGWHARNAPFGRKEAKGSEHLSSVREEHLKTFAAKAGLRYHLLETKAGLSRAMQNDKFVREKIIPVDIRWVFGTLAFLSLLGLYLFDAWQSSQAYRRSFVRTSLKFFSHSPITRKERTL